MSCAGRQLDQIISALIALIVAIIGAIGALFLRQMSDKIDKNTIITQKNADVANGHLQNIIEQLANERNLVIGLRAIVRDRDDRLAYIIARLPDASQMMIDYADRRISSYRDSEDLSDIQ